MKPFNLELAKAGHPVCTRDGHKARIVCFDKEGFLPIVALVNRVCVVEEVFLYDSNGKASPSNESIDIMMASEKREGWINLYKSNNGVVYSGAIHKTKEAAQNDNKCDDLIDTIKIEWEE